MLQLAYPKLAAELELGYKLWVGLKNKLLKLNNQKLQISFSSLTP
jgi:hypothetical protein